MPVTKVAQILAQNASKAFGGQASPGPAGGAYSAPTNLLAGFKSVKSEGRDKGRRKGEKDRRG